MKEADGILANVNEFLKFLRSKFTLIHMSNLFFRDLHYGVMSYLADHGAKMNYKPAEDVTREVAGALERQGILKRIDAQSFLLNYPEFALPKIEKKAS